jgi:hypothetical protein
MLARIIGGQLLRHTMDSVRSSDSANPLEKTNSTDEKNTLLLSSHCAVIVVRRLSSSVMCPRQSNNRIFRNRKMTPKTPNAKNMSHK